MNANVQVTVPGQGHIELARVNTLLGVNGSGKSSMLRNMAAEMARTTPPVVYFEGGRAIQLFEQLPVNSLTGYQETVETMAAHYRKQQTGALVNRIQLIFRLMVKRAEVIRQQHSDEIAIWQDAGQQGQMPAREILPLNKLFTLFSEVFPRLKLRYDPVTEKFSCTKDDGGPYSITGLSDGEKQTLLILAEIATLAEPVSTIIVDEPELNLSGMLAIRLWSMLEDEFQDMRFVYATHNIGFCRRDNVALIYVINESNGAITKIDLVEELSRAELEGFLGIVPAILSSDDVLVTEGDPASFDAIFYRWLSESTKLQPVAVGGCTDVAAIAGRRGIWEAVAPAIKLRGIIDRDYKSDENLQGFESANTMILHFHEAESYICLPDIVVEVAHALGLAEHIPTQELIKEIIRQELIRERLRIIARRVADKMHVRLGVSIKREEQKTLASLEQLTTLLVRGVERERQVVDERFTPGHIDALVQQENQMIDQVLSDDDIEKMLQITPAKAILTAVAKLARAGSPNDYIRACQKHVTVANHSHLASLREVLRCIIQKIIKQFDCVRIADYFKFKSIVVNACLVNVIEDLFVCMF